MGDEGQSYYMKEELEATPQHLNKKQKKTVTFVDDGDKQMTTEEDGHKVEEDVKLESRVNQSTENHDEGKKVTLRVKVIREKPEILAYIPTRYDPFEVNPKTGEKVNKPPRVTVYKHKDESKKRVEVVVSPPGENVEFVGTNYSGEQAASPTNGYAIGILNRETKTMRILPVAYNKIIRLDPRIKTQETEASRSGPGERLTKISQDKMKFLEEKLNKLDINAGALTSTSSIVARNIPPYDALATTASEAYPLEKIIQKGEWNFLKDIYRLLQQERGAAGNSFNAYPVFVRNRLYKLRDIEDNTEKQTFSAALSLLTHLVKFKELNSGACSKLAKSHKFPEIIHRKLTSLFKDSVSKGISTEKTDLLISYVLVLTLHVDKFKTDPEDITKDLRLSTGGLRKHYEQLGCIFASEKSSLLATLTVPLQFPKSMQKRKKR